MNAVAEMNPAVRQAAAKTRIWVGTQGDDLGTNHTTNLAFVEAYKKGVLRNASLLAPAPHIKEAAEMLAGEKGLCFGLHSCLNAEWDSFRWGPVADASKVPSLVRDDGTLHQTTAALYERRPNVEEIRVELPAQLDKARALGFDVRYVDAHMGWTWILKGNTDFFHRWAEKEGISVKWVYQRMPDVAAGGDRVEQLIARLAAAGPGVYRYGGHPAYDNDEMRALGHPGYPGAKVSDDREWERLMFTDCRIIDFFANNGIDPVRHDEAAGKCNG